MTALTELDLEHLRPRVAAHCYRMLGSVSDADDATQETLVRAWKARDQFEGRSALTTWLHRIATNVCLDMLSARTRRTRPQLEQPAGTVDDTLEQRGRTHWIEPVPDAMVVDATVDPFEQARQREQVWLAFVAALQRLPPKQRAALLLVEVVGCSAVEAAGVLGTSIPALNSALQRARATLRVAPTPPAEPSLDQSNAELLERYLAAFEAYDVEQLTALMHEDATFSMPPFTLWLRGRDSIAAWFVGRGIGCKESRLIPTRACGAPAFGQYRPSAAGGHDPWALIVLEVSGDAITEMVSFLDTETLFPYFGLPMHLAQGEDVTPHR